MHLVSFRHLVSPLFDTPPSLSLSLHLSSSLSLSLPLPSPLSTLNLLGAHEVFPPTPADWQPRGAEPDWVCREFSGFCHKNYFARHDAPLELLRERPATATAGATRGSNTSSSGDVRWGQEGGAREARGTSKKNAWQTYFNRARWRTLSPPVDLYDHDPLELAAIAGALLRHHAAEAGGGREVGGGGGRGAGAGESRGEGARAFVVVELGAGMGRWSLETVALARRLGIRVAAVCVEAEPTHLEVPS